MARSLLLSAGLLIAAPVCADAPPPRIESSEASVKAGFLCQFAAYVEWPPGAFPSPESPFVIGVIGADDVAAELDRSASCRVIQNRPARVRRLNEGDSIAGVHLLFIGRGQPNATAILHAAQQQWTLTVTETHRGLEMGSAINFVAADGHVAFEISLDAAERNGLKISSRMLNIARRVVPRS